MVKSDTEVVIVGGGAAGVAAGRRLLEAGIDCLVIEARGRLGGRAWTVVGSSEFPIDLGCGWLHSADRNPWTTIAEAQSRIINKTPPPWTRPSQGYDMAPGDRPQFITALNAFYERVNKAVQTRSDTATADLLPNDRWNGLIGAIGTYITGTELDRVSVHDFANYEDTDVNWRVVEGYGTIIAAHGEMLPKILNCPVQQIDHSGRQLKIKTTKGTITANFVIVTLPSTIIAENEKLFAPVLPEKTQTAASLPLGLADKLFLSLESPEEFEVDSRMFGSIDRVGTATYHFRPFGRPMIEAYFAGKLAADLESRGENAFFAFALEELTGLLGKNFAKRVKPARMHCWGIDPFARGSYSFALPGHADCRSQLAVPINDRLFFAGEACSAHDFSTAHGGWYTGVAAAEQLMSVRRVVSLL
jgi:monoamine oxidase